MERKLIEEKAFDRQDFTNAPLAKGEYEYCQFKACDFSGADCSNSLPGSPGLA